MVHLTPADVLVLKNLTQDIQHEREIGSKPGWENGAWTSTKEPADVNTKTRIITSDDVTSDAATIKELDLLAQQPVVCTIWDRAQLSPLLERFIVDPYVRWAKTIVRRPADIVFLTHVLFYTFTLLPSAVYLWYRFSWSHGILHAVLELWCAGSWTLLLHNHIHNNGIFVKKYSLIDRAFPYVLGPFMGHTWESYYWHHVKHHHVENNGPGDLSSTIMYQRDSVVDFLKYEARFLAFTWLELPFYFLSKKQYSNFVRAFCTEFSSLTLIACAARWNFRPAFFTLVLPLSLMRVGMMVGNWGQHCLVDDIDPNSDFRSSITLIDEASNRHCFNDGYHTSHHLNARRHWSDHPASFMKTKERYQKEGALTFRDIDYIMMTVKVLSKDYDYLAKRLVPMGDQIAMSHQERMDMLRSKTRKLSKEEIREKFAKTT